MGSMCKPKQSPQSTVSLVCAIEQRKLMKFGMHDFISLMRLLLGERLRVNAHDRALKRFLSYRTPSIKPKSIALFHRFFQKNNI